MEEKIEKVKSLIRESKNIVALTGAGISAESGIPTFRGKDGLWKKYRAEELATPEAFRRDPKLVWEWYNWRREIISKSKPNPGHYALVEIERKKGNSFTLITQNVDGLHRKAGNKNILELHGNIWYTRCTQCGAIEEDLRVPIPIPPYCEKCGGLLRPNVVWFGESLDPDVIDRSIRALKNADIFLSIGTSSVVQPAASFINIAKSNGAICIEINLEKTPNSYMIDIGIYGKAGEILPKIIP